MGTRVVARQDSMAIDDLNVPVRRRHVDRAGFKGNPLFQARHREMGAVTQDLVEMGGPTRTDMHSNDDGGTEVLRQSRDNLRETFKASG